MKERKKIEHVKNYHISRIKEYTKKKEEQGETMLDLVEFEELERDCKEKNL